MKNFDRKSFFAGIFCSCAISGLIIPAFAAVTGSMTPNLVNVIADGKTISKEGENYTLQNGTSAPGSITYEDENGGWTVYLPVRKLSETLGVEIGWNESQNAVVVGDGASDIPQNETSDFSGYKDYPSVPDFATLYPDDTTLQDIKTSNDGSATVYVYNGTSGTIGTIPYRRLLESAGFQFVNKFDFDTKWGVVQVGKVDQYKKDGLYVSFGYSPEGTFSVMISTYQTDGNTFFYMGESAGTEDIAYYSRYPSVPDFGAFAGIPESDIGKLAGLDGYYYDVLDLDDALSRNENLLIDYHSLLLKCGFIYIGDFEGGNGPIECYTDGQYSIGVGIIDSRFFAVVAIND